MRNICSPYAPRQITSIESLSPKMGDWVKYQRGSWSAWQFPVRNALLPLALQAQGFYSLPWSRGTGVLNKMLWATTFPAAGLPSLRGRGKSVMYTIQTSGQKATPLFSSWD